MEAEVILNDLLQQNNALYWSVSRSACLLFPQLWNQIAKWWWDGGKWVLHVPYCYMWNVARKYWKKAREKHQGCITAPGEREAVSGRYTGVLKQIWELFEKKSWPLFLLM